MSNSRADTGRLDQLAESFAERYRRGERPALSEYIDEHPDLAEQIRELFPALVMMEQVDQDLQQQTRGHAADPAAEAAVTQLGDFRIIREVGRGGMGVVYEAEQVSLGRRVALKVLPRQRLANEKHAQRFDREARAAARLHHTNIVPVFGVGEQDGVHYYVMQFIHGLGLDEVLVEIKRLREQSALGKSVLPRAAQPPTALPAVAGGQEEHADSDADAQAFQVAQSLLAGRFEKTQLDAGSDGATAAAGVAPPAETGSAPPEARQRLATTTEPVTAASAIAADTTAARQAETAVVSGAFPWLGQSDAGSRAHSHQVYWESVARIGVQAAEALHYAHDQGIIHRDVKPGNLLLDTRGGLWITDFGLAKAADQQNLTHTGDVLGTLRYMAPEQFDGRADARSDVYALGLTLYELLSLQPGFDEQDRHKLIKQVTTATPRRLRTIDAYIPRDLETIIHKAIERDPTQRYQSAGELAADLQRYLRDEPIRARRISPITRFTRWCRRNPAVAGLTTTVAVLLAAAAAVSSLAAVQFEGLAEHNGELAFKAKTAQTAAEKLTEQEKQLRIESQEAQAAAEAARKDADEQRQLADERELLARHNLYTAHMNLAFAAFDESDVPRVVDLLQRHVPAPGEPDWRSFEWYYLLGLCNQDELTLKCYHSGHKPAFSPDGTTLAVGIYGTRIEFWNLERRERVQVISAPMVQGPLAYSPDGSLLASTRNGAVQVWDVATGVCLHSLEGHEHHILSVAFTPDGSKVISTDGGNIDTKSTPGVVRIWDTESGALIHELKGYSSFISEIAVSPDSTRLVTSGFDQLWLWDLTTGERIESFKAATGGWQAVAWSPDGDSIATYGTDWAYGPGDVLILDTSTGAIRSRFPAPRIGSLAYSPDGQLLVSAGHDGTARVWNVQDGREIGVYKGHSQWLGFVTFSPDGNRIASVSRDLTVKVWPVHRPAPYDALAGIAPRSTWSPARTRTASFANGTRVVVMKDPTTIALIDVATGNIGEILPIGEDVKGTAVSSDGQRLAVAVAGGIQFWDIASQSKTRELRMDATPLTVDYSPDDALLAVGTDAHQIEIYAADTLARVAVLPHQYAQHLKKVLFSPDGRSLATTTMGDPIELQLWDVDGWRLRVSLRIFDRIGTDLAFSADSGLLAASEGTGHQEHDGARTRVLDVDTGTEVAVLQGEDAFHSAVTFAPDGNTLITGSNTGTITLWDLTTYEERATLQWAGHLPEMLAITPDGRTLVGADNWNKIRLWRSADEAQVQQAELSGLYRRASQYASDGRLQEAAELFTHLLELSDDTDLREGRANVLAELGAWEEAAADLTLVVGSTTTNYRPWYELALTQLVQGDVAAYRSTCAEMLQRFGSTQDEAVAEFVCWTHALRPAADLNWGQLVALSMVPFVGGDGGTGPRTALGAILLRAGLYEDAKLELESAAAATSQDLNRTTLDYTWYLLAQTHVQLGDPAAAQSCLERIDPRESDSGDSEEAAADGSHWFRRATLQLLRDETEMLLESRSVQNASESDEVRAERWQRALAIYSSAIERRDEVPLLRRLRARAYERLGAAPEAAADLARAEQLDREIPLRRLNAFLSTTNDFELLRWDPLESTCRHASLSIL